MNLLRLPFVVLIDVFKNMEFKEIFLISLLSKRARNTLKVTSVPVELSIFTSEVISIESKTDNQISRVPEDTSDYFIGGEVMELSFYSFGVILREESPRKQLLFANHMLDTFKSSSIVIKFFDNTLPSTALEFMKMINQKKLSIGKLYYHITGNSSEYIPRILDECTEVTNSVCIDAKFPEDFVYTPSRPFKTEHFGVDKTVNWLNLEGFMNCRRITAYLFHWKTRTEQYWNSFFTKWMDSDARLEKLMLCFLEAPEFRNIMNALGNQGTKRKIDYKWIELKRRDGSEFFIEQFQSYIVVYTKQAYLEKMNKKKEFALTRKLATNV